MSTVFGFLIYTKYSSHTSHRAQIPSSSDEVSSDGSELEFARSNDDGDDDSSQVEDQQQQGVGVRGRGCMQPRRRGRDVDLEEGVAEVDKGLSVKQSVEWGGGILVELHRISTY